jgi:hypothetical protein
VHHVGRLPELEQRTVGRVHHVGRLPELEQRTVVTPYAEPVAISRY